MNLINRHGIKKYCKAKDKQISKAALDALDIRLNAKLDQMLIVSKHHRVSVDDVIITGKLQVLTAELKAITTKTITSIYAYQQR